jgi:TetR/AcrR family transcriptional regulator, transcriptional repressor for nem operon
MAGKKAFDPQRVLEKAMHAFWERGYEGISIEDLVQSTGIGRGSLYGTFDDKHSLYLAALDQYVAAVRAQTSALLEQEGALHEVLQQLFQAQLEALLSDPARRGCFLVNASLEMAPHDPQVNTVVQSALQEFEECLYRLLIKAQVAGELSWKHDPHQLAHFLLGTFVSLRVLARGQPDRRVLEDVVTTAVSVFD